MVESQLQVMYDCKNNVSVVVDNMGTEIVRGDGRNIAGLIGLAHSRIARRCKQKKLKLFKEGVFNV